MANLWYNLCMTKILDCTTRDGGHPCNWEFSDEFIHNHIKFLNNEKVSYYEIGYRNYCDTEGKGRFYRCTPQLLKQFYEQKGNLEIGVMTDTSRYSAEDFAGKSQDYLDFVRVAVHPDKIPVALEIAEDLHSKGYKVFVQLMDVSNIDADGYLYLYMWENKAILESLYFADSYSKLQPSDVPTYYNKLKILGYDRISFHAHNNAGLAFENSLVAASLGAYTIDVTQDGVGRSGGNLDYARIKGKLA